MIMAGGLRVSKTGRGQRSEVIGHKDGLLRRRLRSPGVFLFISQHVFVIWNLKKNPKTGSSTKLWSVCPLKVSRQWRRRSSPFHKRSLPSVEVETIPDAIRTFFGFLRSLMFIILAKVSGKKLVPWGTDGRLPLSDLDVDLGSGHTAYSRASLIDLYLRTKFHCDWKRKFLESHHWGFGQVQSHVTQKLGQISEIRPDQI